MPQCRPTHQSASKLIVFASCSSVQSEKQPGLVDSLLAEPAVGQKGSGPVCWV